MASDWFPRQHYPPFEQPGTVERGSVRDSVSWKNCVSPLSSLVVTTAYFSVWYQFSGVWCIRKLTVWAFFRFRSNILTRICMESLCHYASQDKEFQQLNVTWWISQGAELPYVWDVCCKISKHRPPLLLRVGQLRIAPRLSTCYVHQFISLELW